jgi:uncharacterized protein
MDLFNFAAHQDFLNREVDLERLEDWWSGSERNALALYGRRRVGKSWLFRRFAHSKPALVLVADRRDDVPQLDRFADALEPHLGVRPDLPDVAALIRALYTLAADKKLLVVIDEFPYLLPSGKDDQTKIASSIQAVMEERDASQLKLVLCGSYITQMERLLSGPLRGRLTPLLTEPLPFRDAQAFIPNTAAPVERIERYAVSGGMALYLDELGRGGSLRDLICDRALNPRGPLFNDPREILEEQLQAPSVYYSILEELSAKKSRDLGDIAATLGRKGPDLTFYLDRLRGMRVVERFAPLGSERGYRYSLSDGFMRFWFRFVFPFQEDLRTGLAPRTLYEHEISPVFGDYISPSFEDLCREWLRHTGRATRVGRWWGNALDTFREKGLRQTEEVDVVGMTHGSVTVVGECKWTHRPFEKVVLENLETYKLPALKQGKLRVRSAGPEIILFSKSGFARELIEIAAVRDDLRLVDAAELVADLLA